MQTATQEVVLGTFIGWTIRVNPGEVDQKDLDFHSATDVAQFIRNNRLNGKPMLYFSRFSGPDGEELESGYSPNTVIGSPAYRLTCVCKAHMWFKGTRDLPAANYDFSYCEECRDSRGPFDGSDRNRYDGSRHEEREY